VRSTTARAATSTYVPVQRSCACEPGAKPGKRTTRRRPRVRRPSPLTTHVGPTDRGRAPDQKDPVATPSSPGVVGRISHSDRLIVELVNTGSTPVVILIRPQLSTARKRVGASFLIARPPLRSLTGRS